MEQLSFSFLESERKNYEKKNVILSERDLEIIEFICVMKFANLEVIYKKFFQILKNGKLSKSSAWCAERLAQLEKFGVIESVMSFSENHKYWLVREKGYQYLIAKKPELKVCRPMRMIDQRYFLHDKNVLEARMRFERLGATGWISDRMLRSFPEASGGIEAGSVPDGIYTTSSKVKVAFEMERSSKTKADYRLKIKKFVLVMRREASAFQRVHFICLRNGSYQFLKEETKIYGDLFIIERFSDFFDPKISSLVIK